MVLEFMRHQVFVLVLTLEAPSLALGLGLETLGLVLVLEKQVLNTIPETINLFPHIYVNLS